MFQGSNRMVFQFLKSQESQRIIVETLHIKAKYCRIALSAKIYCNLKFVLLYCPSMKTPQLTFDYFNIKATKKKYGRTTHGGTPTKGKRKEFRPLSSRKTIHLVLKSDKATGTYSFLNLKNKPMVEQIIYTKAKKFGVKIAEIANAGNHLHIKLRAQSREAFQKFLKAVTCLIARKVTGARKGKKFGRFWQGLAFTRVIKTKFEELQLTGYFEANRRQIKDGYAAREAFLSDFNDWVYKLKRESG